MDEVSDFGELFYRQGLPTDGPPALLTNMI
jgi:hypothetical protein